jgi:hypothetical protein
MKKENEAPEKQGKELTENDLEKVAGGLRRAGGDDDLDELEVER